LGVDPYDAITSWESDAMRSAQWEYTTVLIDVSGWISPTVDPETVSAELNRYGAEGWELASAFDLNRGQGETSRVVALLKRPRS
jgi:hypothetical protein